MSEKLLFLFTALALAFPISAQAPKPVAPKATAAAGNAKQGKVEYQNQCASCHDNGVAGPALTGFFKRNRMRDKKRTPVTEASVRDRITSGGDGMPPFASLKPKQLDDLIAHLKTL